MLTVIPTIQDILQFRSDSVQRMASWDISKPYPWSQYEKDIISLLMSVIKYDSYQPLFKENASVVLNETFENDFGKVAEYPLNFTNRFLGDNKCRLTADELDDARSKLGVADIENLGIVEYFHFRRYVTIVLKEAMKKPLKHPYKPTIIKGIELAELDDVGNAYVLKEAGACRSRYISYALNKKTKSMLSMSTQDAQYMREVSSPYWWIMKGKSRSSYEDAIKKGILSRSAIDMAQEKQMAFNL